MLVALLVPLCTSLPRPQNTQAILLAPLNLVRGAGQAVFNTGGAVINAVPSTVDFLSNTAVSGVQFVPQSVNAVSDFTVNSINGGTRAPLSTLPATWWVPASLESPQSPTTVSI